MDNRKKLERKVSNMERELAEMKKLLKQTKVWEPKGGNFTIISDGTVIRDNSIYYHRNFGTERPTEAQAEKARDEMRIFNRLLAYRDEFAPDYTPEWTKSTDKYYVYFNRNDKCWSKCYSNKHKTPGCIYMPKEIADALVGKLNKGEVVL